MYRANSGAYAMDYVYVLQGTEEFRNVHVDFKLVKGKQTLTLITAESISIPDLEGILQGLQSNPFKKMKVKLNSDCDLYLQVRSPSESELYEIVLTGDDLRIQELILKS